MAVDLPIFRFHPDPVGTGSVEVSEASCPVCGLRRGYVYTGPVYTEIEVEGLCPWCIADGAAAERYDAEFTDVGEGVPDDVDEELLTELTTRTPGFLGWQQEHWLYHCGCPAAFLGLSSDPNSSEQVFRFVCLSCGAPLSYEDAD